MVPCCWQGPYGDTPRRPDGSKHRPGPWADRSNTGHRRPVVTRVKPAVRGHPFVLTVITSGDAPPPLEPGVTAFYGVAFGVRLGVECRWLATFGSLLLAVGLLVHPLRDGVADPSAPQLFAG